MASKDDDWLNLDEPATEPVRKPQPKPASPKPATPRPADTTAEAQPSTTDSKRSVFDDDLPQLAALEEVAPRTSMPDLLNVDLEELVPVKPKPTAKPNRPPTPNKANQSTDGKNQESPKKPPALDPANAQYRCACPSCGTPQYVTPARQGKMVRCPDCFTEFKIPPPPPGWVPTTPANIKFGTDLVDASPTDTQQFRSNAEDLLRNAEKDLDDDDIDSMYDSDFDNATFMRRTFGFVTDATAMFQIAMFSLFFAMLFAAEFYCLGKINENRAYALFAALLVPMFAVLISFPMFGTALAILESVANGQSKVREWQGFNLFDHIGEMMLFAIAAAVSALPGFIIGSMIGKSVDNALIVILATMVSSFLTFPIVLLSMLDNESMVNPFSPDVFKSLRVGFEAWGTYYFKTFSANLIVFILWAILLRPNPILAAIGGLLFPLLFFFTIQQLGILAFDISEHLSFVVPDKADDDEVKQVETTDPMAGGR